MTSAIAKLSENFVETSIDDEMVVMDIRSGSFFSLTGTALAIWQLIDGTRDRAAILAGLLEAFPEGDAQVIAEDLDHFLKELGESELVSV